MYRTISDEALAQAMETGDFPEEVTRAADKVVVIMTQDWCPDWHAMEPFLPEFQDKAAFFLLVYNKHPQFKRIMAFKEDVLGNREIPYLRYYHQGQLIVATNQLPRGTFAAMLGRTEPFTIA